MQQPGVNPMVGVNRVSHHHSFQQLLPQGAQLSHLEAHFLNRFTRSQAPKSLMCSHLQAWCHSKWFNRSVENANRMLFQGLHGSWNSWKNSFLISLGNYLKILFFPPISGKLLNEGMIQMLNATNLNFFPHSLGHLLYQQNVCHCPLQKLRED